MISRQPDPIEAVIDRLHQPNQPRAGDRSNRLWWVCPFHEDRNPSLCVEPGKAYFKCYGCGASGDAIGFARRLDSNLTFREAVDVVGGELAPSSSRPAKLPPRRPRPDPRPEGWQAFARDLVERAEGLLWTAAGAATRDALQRRGLAPETIRAARLGFQGADRFVSGVFPDQSVFVPTGIVIPWFAGDEVALVNVRRPQAAKKYWAIRGSRRGGIYPSRSVVAAGSPLVVAEGELDALLLGQCLAGLAPVMTLGSASDRPKPDALAAMLRSPLWLIASDADEAGDLSAGRWLQLFDRCRRARSPYGKDWTDAHQAGVDLRRWWSARLAGEVTPAPFVWAELARWRWGPAVPEGVEHPGREGDTFQPYLAPDAQPVPGTNGAKSY